MMKSRVFPDIARVGANEVVDDLGIELHPSKNPAISGTPRGCWCERGCGRLGNRATTLVQIQPFSELHEKIASYMENLNRF